MDSPKIPINQFDIVLFKELGIDEIDADKKAELLDTIAEIVQNRLAVRIVDVLTEQELNQLADLIKSGDDKALGEFLDSNVPDYHAIVAEEIRRVKVELFEDVAETRKALQQYADSTQTNKTT